MLVTSTAQANEFVAHNGLQGRLYGDLDLGGKYMGRQGTTQLPIINTGSGRDTGRALDDLDASVVAYQLKGGIGTVLRGKRNILGHEGTVGFHARGAFAWGHGHDWRGPTVAPAGTVGRLVHVDGSLSAPISSIDYAMIDTEYDAYKIYGGASFQTPLGDTAELGLQVYGGFGGYMIRDETAFAAPGFDVETDTRLDSYKFSGGFGVYPVFPISPTAQFVIGVSAGLYVMETDLAVHQNVNGSMFRASDGNTKTSYQFGGQASVNFQPLPESPVQVEAAAAVVNYGDVPKAELPTQTGKPQRSATNRVRPSSSPSGCAWPSRRTSAGESPHRFEDRETGGRITGPPFPLVGVQDLLRGRSQPDPATVRQTPWQRGLEEIPAFHPANGGDSAPGSKASVSRRSPLVNLPKSDMVSSLFSSKSYIFCRIACMCCRPARPVCSMPRQRLGTSTT
ncbi:MAG: hypothetical protein R3316_12260 [Rhodovibrionaceae bacterium]|nr:hypothetical protein [Rhodovibrionaceae bacterium]